MAQKMKYYKTGTSSGTSTGTSPAPTGTSSAKYTWDDFSTALKNSGLNGQFSDADLRLAQSNPDAGMAILNYKMDYGNATTDEQRAIANAGAESIRSSYGNYTGGTDGSGYYLNQLSPSSFSAGSAPSYQSSLQAPSYTSKYQSRIDDALNRVTDTGPFSYNASTDPLYSQYRKQYAREGQRSAQDVLGQYAANTGGLASTAAVSAAAQQQNYYNAQMADKIPELYQLAYNKYLSDFQMNQSKLDALNSAEAVNYNRYLDQLSQYNTDRNFEYGQYQDQLSQYNTDRNFNYQQLLDEIDSQTNERNEAYNRALTGAEYGDYSGMEAMGYDMSNVPSDIDRDYDRDDEYWQRMLDLAQLGANGGDYSGYQQLAAYMNQRMAEQRAEQSNVLSESDWNLLASIYGEDYLKARGYTKRG